LGFISENNFNAGNYLLFFSQTSFMNSQKCFIFKQCHYFDVICCDFFQNFAKEYERNELLPENFKTSCFLVKVSKPNDRDEQYLALLDIFFKYSLNFSVQRLNLGFIGNLNFATIIFGESRLAGPENDIC